MVFMRLTSIVVFFLGSFLDKMVLDIFIFSGVEAFPTFHHVSCMSLHFPSAAGSLWNHADQS